MVKLSWERRNAVENPKLDGLFSYNRSHIVILFINPHFLRHLGIKTSKRKTDQGNDQKTVKKKGEPD